MTSFWLGYGVRKDSLSNREWTTPYFTFLTLPRALFVFSLQWTPDGDAFVIGSDLARLESETLPQYFRHNRFQSLVRQLNFYSFRKINRERNVWIYKHNLFRRDHPEDLHLVRRRTCPGADGRKQRFSRFSARKVNQVAASTAVKSPDKKEPQVSSQVAKKSLVADKPSPKTVPQKRSLERSVVTSVSPTKRSRIWNSGSSSKQKEQTLTPVIDDSMLNTVSPTDTQKTEESSVLIGSKHDRSEMVEQSMIVSDVAMKLEQFARKAMKARSSSRQNGIVTPPFSRRSDGAFSASSGVLTYDDEDCGYETYDHPKNGRQSSNSSLGGIVTESEASSVAEDTSLTSGGSSSSSPSGAKLTPPVSDLQTVKGIKQRLLSGSPLSAQRGLKAPTALAGFCMSTSPTGDKDLCSKILQLFSSSDTLLSDFQSYRAALHPTLPPCVPNTKKHRDATIQQIWARTASREDAVRDFKIFAVNCIRMILRKSKVLCKGDLMSNVSSMTLISSSDREVLKRTADAWQKSVGVTV